jgi:antitoxin YefM
MERDLIRAVYCAIFSSIFRSKYGKPAGVLLSPAEYDDLVYQKAFLDSINRGIADSEKGRVLSTEELKTELQKRRKQE